MKYPYAFIAASGNISYMTVDEQIAGLELAIDSTFDNDPCVALFDQKPGARLPYYGFRPFGPEGVRAFDTLAEAIQYTKGE
jgi:hypothetical protein